MNIVPNKIDYNYIYYSNPVKNIILDYGSFIRICYSDSIVNLNGLYSAIKIKITSSKKYFNKVFLNFDYEENKKVIDEIINLEKYLLKNIDENVYKSVFKLREQLLSGVIRVYNNYTIDNIFSFEKNEAEIMLKISGIWINDNSYGLTFKYITIT